MSDNEQWHMLPGAEDGDDDEEEYASEWAPVIMAAIAGGVIIFICLICGETATSIASTIWGKP